MRLMVFILLSTGTALGGFLPGTNLTMVDTGVSALGSDQLYTHALYQMPNGEPRVVYGFRATGQKAQLWDFSLSNYDSVVITLTNALPGLSMHIPTPSNSVVYATMDNGYIYEYYPRTGVTTYIKKVNNEQCYTANLCTDGLIVFGTYGSANSSAIETFDVTTHTGTEWGKLDPTSSGAVYVYYVGGDSDYLYGVIRNGSEYYVAAMRKSDKTTANWGKGAGNPGSRLARGSGDSNWYVNVSSNSQSLFYQLNGISTPTLLGGDPGMLSDYKRAGFNNDPAKWTAEESWDVEPSFAVVEVAGSTAQASVRFRKTGTTEWTNIVQDTGWLLGAYQFTRLVPYGNSSLIWATKNYGPVGTFDGSTLSLLGNQAGLSWYDILTVTNSTVYFAGYHNQLKRYDPTQSWTWTPSTPDTDETANPHFIGSSTWGKYHYYLARARDDRIFAGSQVAYSSSQGELDWYTPSTEATSKETTQFATHGCADIKTAGNAIVYVSNNADGKVYIWDTATDLCITNFSPIGAVTLDKVVEYSSGKLIGISGARVFAFDVGGSLLWTNVLLGTAWSGSFPSYDHRITLGPDGFVWQCVSGKLYRISTSDGSSTNLCNTTYDYNTVFLGNNLYLYGGQNGTKVYKIVNAVIPFATTVTNLRVSTIRGK